MIFYEPGCAIRHLLERKGIAIDKPQKILYNVFVAIFRHTVT